MARFTYTARDNKGERLSGSEEAVSLDELTSRLQAKGLTVININILPEAKEEKSALKPEAKEKKRRYRHSRVSSDDLVIFSRQLAALLGSGVTILKSIDIISKQVYSRKLYNTLKEIEGNLEGGLSFHEAIAKQSDVFADLWVNLAESGEASGNLAVVLGRLATYLEVRAAFKKKIVSALVYPVILMFAGIGALLFLTLKIIPTFAELFKSFNVTLPTLTRIIISFSNFLQKYFLVIIGIIVVFSFIFKRYIKTKEGRRNFERFQLSLPVFGEFFRALIVERFSSEMSTLIESGVPLLYSLEITEHSVSSLTMEEIVRQIKEDVREGKPLNSSLDKSGFFEPMVIQMVAIGEEIGELPQMFKRINTFYMEYTETFLTRFTAMFEPLMLIFMGGVIGLMVAGIFLPIFQLTQMR
ncbi:MAG: type II secretion system F family protein [Candidatus Omnitrophica bacterium]|nr:type II secretion system F family protein [Candidatus Omnitrophota bacterium]MDD5592871.1 type II secretion system F family protein [Candidatus Omnitrophota bacterium]